MTIVKICGITTLEDGLIAAGAGADMLGFNFYRPSPRYITPADCHPLSAALRQELGPRCPLLVGVFVDEPAVAAIMDQAGLDAAQLCGAETPDQIASLAGRAFKALRPQNRNEAWTQAAVFGATSPQDDRLPSVLVDAYHRDLYGGTGEQASAAVAAAVQEQVPRLMLAGGLTPDNVGDRILAIRPWGVDVASGVEGATKGRKDESCIRAFMAAVTIADAQL